MTAIAEVTALVERYRAGFFALDPDVLVAIWDRDHDGLVYVAQELADPLHGWPAIEDYYRRLAVEHPVSEVLEMRVDDLTVDVLGEVAVAFGRFRFAGSWPDRDEPFVAEGRVTFVCHLVGGAWAVIHYHESTRALPAGSGGAPPGR